MIKPTTISMIAISSFDKFAGPWMPLLTPTDVFTHVKKTSFRVMNIHTESFPFAKAELVKHADIRRHF